MAALASEVDHCADISLLQARFVPDEEDNSNVPVSKNKSQRLESFVMTAQQAKQCKQEFATALFERCGGVAISFAEHPAVKDFLQVS